MTAGLPGHGGAHSHVAPGSGKSYRLTGQSPPGRDRSKVCSRQHRLQITRAADNRHNRKSQRSLARRCRTDIRCDTSGQPRHVDWKLPSRPDCQRCFCFRCKAVRCHRKKIFSPPASGSAKSEGDDRVAPIVPSWCCRFPELHS